MTFEQYKRLVGSIGFGKALPGAIYLHWDAVSALPDALAALIDRIATAVDLPRSSFNIVKLAKDDFRISFLEYPTFDTDPYPALLASHTLDLESKSHRTASYADSKNPPILHRRELFVAPNDPRRDTFAAFTAEGEAIGAYVNSRSIGTRKGWDAALRRLGYRVGPDGHLITLQLTSEHMAPDEDARTIDRHKTALSRTDLSVPVFTLSAGGFLDGRFSVLDYGCGRGDDLATLLAAGLDCAGWDPVYLPDEEPEAADLVNLGYVINVIEDKDERTETLRRAFALSKRLLAVSAMLGNDAVFERFRPYKDGVVTKTGTFQKYYFQSELQEYIESSLNVDALAAGPGLFFVFRDQELQQEYLTNKQRTRIDGRSLARKAGARAKGAISEAKIRANAPLLRDLWETVLELGRPPASEEFEQADAARSAFGTLPRAIAACEKTFGVSDYQAAENVRKNDLIVYLALEHFSKRRPYRRMPGSLRRDIKYHLGKYSDARLLAQSVLFSVSDAVLIEQACADAHATLPASVLTEGEGLTFHKDFLNLCPPALRIYVGCALQLYGDLVSIDLIKVHIKSGKVTLLGFDDFNSKRIPRLTERIKVKMAEQDIDFFDYVLGFEPPPLLNKSQYLDPTSEAFKEQSVFDADLRGAIGEAIDEPYMKAARLRELLQASGTRIREGRVVRAGA